MDDKIITLKHMGTIKKYIKEKTKNQDDKNYSMIVPEEVESLTFEEGADPDRIVHKNYLKNWNFADPVNTTGQTDWTSASSANFPVFDDWHVKIYAKTTVDISSSEYLLVNGFNNSSSSGYASFKLGQNMSLPGNKSFLGKTITISCLCQPLSANTTVSLTAEDVDNGWRVEQVGGTLVNNQFVSNTTNLSVCSTTYTFPDEISDSSMWADPKSCAFYITAKQSNVSRNTKGAYVKIYACKIEISDTQTLAYQDENNQWIVNLISTEGETVDLDRYIASANQIKAFHLIEKNNTPFLNSPKDVDSTLEDSNGTLIVVNYSGEISGEENLKCKQIFISHGDGKVFTRHFNFNDKWSAWVSNTGVLTTTPDPSTGTQPNTNTDNHRFYQTDVTLTGSGDANNTIKIGLNLAADISEAAVNGIKKKTATGRIKITSFEVKGSYNRTNDVLESSEGSGSVGNSVPVIWINPFTGDLFKLRICFTALDDSDNPFRIITSELEASSVPTSSTLLASYKLSWPFYFVEGM